MFAAARRFYDRLEGVRDLLTDPTTTSVRLVVNPEKMVVAEARRTYTYLSLFGYRVDAVVANRLLPDDVERSRGSPSGRRSTPSTWQPSTEAFAPLPILPRRRWRPPSWSGSTALREFGAVVYGEPDPAARLHRGRTDAAPPSRRRVRAHRCSCRSSSVATSSSAGGATSW